MILITSQISSLFFFRFRSRQTSKSGFRIEYMTLKMSTACGGNFSDATGSLTSPLYNASYPELMDCVYLVSQPHGMFINVSLSNMDISCHGTPSDFVELRDGNNGDSPLMGSFCGNGGNIPNFMQTTQNHLRIRCHEMKSTYIIPPTDEDFFPRFSSNYFKSGLGFQLKYETSDQFQGMIHRFDECGGYFSTAEGSITSPTYPNKQEYPINARCIYAISQPTDTVIHLGFMRVDLEATGGACGACCDYLEIRDGPSEDATLLHKLCGNEIPEPIQSTGNHLWMK